MTRVEKSSRPTEKRDTPVTVFYEFLVEQGVLKPEDFSYSSLYRFLKTLGLAGSKQKKELERKRFAYEKVKAMWHADISSGPYIKMRKRKVPTFLFAFLDDASRLVPYTLYTLDQGFDSLKTVFKEALSRRGIPQMIYTDNGEIYTSQQFQRVCASLGIALVHTRPYDPSAKGKIERFLLSVRQRFLSTLDCEGLTLDSLSQSFLTWLERDYNSRPHSTIGMSPIDMYMSHSSSLKMLDDPSILEPLFLRREIRKVVGLVSSRTQLFHPVQFEKGPRHDPTSVPNFRQTPPSKVKMANCCGVRRLPLCDKRRVS